MSNPEEAPARRPLLTVVRGDPTPEELAALVAVLAARASANGTGVGSGTAAASRYADPAAGHRAPLRTGAGAWVASGWVPGTRTKAAL